MIAHRGEPAAAAARAPPRCASRCPLRDAGRIAAAARAARGRRARRAATAARAHARWRARVACAESPLFPGAARAVAPTRTAATRRLALSARSSRAAAPPMSRRRARTGDGRRRSLRHTSRRSRSILQASTPSSGGMAAREGMADADDDSGDALDLGGASSARDGAASSRGVAVADNGREDTRSSPTTRARTPTSELDLHHERARAAPRVSSPAPGARGNNATPARRPRADAATASVPRGARSARVRRARRAAAFGPTREGGCERRAERRRRERRRARERREARAAAAREGGRARGRGRGKGRTGTRLVGATARVAPVAAPPRRLDSAQARPSWKTRRRGFVSARSRRAWRRARREQHLPRARSRRELGAAGAALVATLTRSGGSRSLTGRWRRAGRARAKRAKPSLARVVDSTVSETEVAGRGKPENGSSARPLVSCRAPAERHHESTDAAAAPARRTVEARRAHTRRRRSAALRAA